MNFFLFLILFYAFSLTAASASDVAREGYPLYVYKEEPDSSLIDKNEDINGGFNRANNGTRNEGDSLEPSSLHSFQISDPFMPHLSPNSDNPPTGNEAIRDNSLLTEINAERILEQVFERNREGYGNFVEPFILCDFPNPFTTNMENVYCYLVGLLIGVCISVILILRYVVGQSA
jgi:hypothetical protein